MISKSKILGSTSAIALALASAGASALPATELFFSQAAGWDTNPSSWTFNPGGTGFTGLDFSDGSLAPGAPAGTSTNSKWCESESQGAETRCSSIEITSFTNSDSPLRFTPGFAGFDGDGMWNEGDIWVIDTLTQTNRILRTGSNIPDPTWIADTIANLEIFDDALRTNRVSGDDGFLDSRVTIEFWESNNRRLEENCLGPNPLGTLCDDVYRVQAGDFVDVGFNLGDYRYTISFDLIPLASTAGNPPVDIGPSLVCPNALDTRCDTVTVDDGEIWIYTPETDPGTSTIAVAMSWSARLIPVAAPGVLLLMGMGAVAGGLVGRRRNS